MSDVMFEVSVDKSKVDEGLEEIGLPKTDHNRNKFVQNCVGQLEMCFGEWGIYKQVIEDIKDLKKYADWEDFDHFEEEE